MLKKEEPKILINTIHFAIVSVLVLTTILLFVSPDNNVRIFSLILASSSLLVKIISILFLKQTKNLFQLIILLIFTFLILLSLILHNSKASGWLLIPIIVSVIYMFFGKKIQTTISTKIENNSYFNEDNHNPSKVNTSDINNEKTQIINN